MDAIKTYDDEAIERFVLNQMPDEELDAFLAYLTLHPEIQPDIDACRMRVKAIRGASLTPKTKNWRKWAWLIAPLLGIGVAAWFFLPVKPAETPLPAPPPTIPPPAVQKQEPFAQAPDIRVVPPKEDPKRFAAAFRSNENLEMQLNSGLRSQGIEFNIETPTPKALLKIQSGKVRFNLSGTVKQDKTAGLGTFRVLIFDNQQAHVEAMRFIAAYNLPLTAKGNMESRFQLAQKIKLTPGLYYYIIKDDKDEWQFVGSFRVE
jgi:hypothetical protein